MKTYKSGDIVTKEEFIKSKYYLRGAVYWSDIDKNEKGIILEVNKDVIKIFWLKEKWIEETSVWWENKYWRLF